MNENREVNTKIVWGNNGAMGYLRSELVVLLAGVR